MAWLRMIHFLALGLWVGASAFFSFCTALPIIGRMRDLAQTPGNWLGLTDEKQGTRIAGEALDVVFARYFPFQVACGTIALLTAAFWFTSPGLVNKARFAFIALGVGLATLNLTWLAPQVHTARLQRYDANAEVAKAADAAFAGLHTFSLAFDLAALACAAIALSMAAWLPTESSGRP
jgi:hypothetical protein